MYECKERRKLIGDRNGQKIRSFIALKRRPEQEWIFFVAYNTDLRPSQCFRLETMRNKLGLRIVASWTKVVEASVVSLFRRP